MRAMPAREDMFARSRKQLVRPTKRLQRVGGDVLMAAWHLSRANG